MTTYIDNSRYPAEINSAIVNKACLVVAIEDETKAVREIIAYSNPFKPVSDKQRVCDIIYSMYYNTKTGTPKEIADKHSFIVIKDEQEIRTFSKRIKDLSYALNHLETVKIAAKEAAAIENIIYKQAKKYKDYGTVSN